MNAWISAQTGSYSGQVNQVNLHSRERSNGAVNHHQTNFDDLVISAPSSWSGGGGNNLDGVFTIDTSGVSATSGSWTLVDIASKSFGAGFLIEGFADPEDDGIWIRTDGSAVWLFNEITGVLATGTAYDLWAAAKGLTALNNDAGLDTDKDGRDNLGEFAFNGDPLDGSDTGFQLVATEDTDADTLKELTLTLAVRNGSGPPVFSGPPAPSAVVDG